MSYFQEDYVSGRVDFNMVEFENAKSSLIFEIIEQEKTPGDASHESMLSDFRKVPKDYNRCALVSCFHAKLKPDHYL